MKKRNHELQKRVSQLEEALLLERTKVKKPATSPSSEKQLPTSSQQESPPSSQQQESSPTYAQVASPSQDATAKVPPQPPLPRRNAAKKSAMDSLLLEAEKIIQQLRNLAAAADSSTRPRTSGQNTSHAPPAGSKTLNTEGEASTGPTPAEVLRLRGPTTPTVPAHSLGPAKNEEDSSSKTDRNP